MVNLIAPKAGELVMNHACELYIKVNEQYLGIANVTSLDNTNSGVIKDWKPAELKGATQHLKTANDEKIAINGKRTLGDPGNDALCALYRKTGMDANQDFAFVAADGRVMLFNATVNLSKIDSSGEMDDLAAIEGELLLNGYPTFDTVDDTTTGDETEE